MMCFTIWCKKSFSSPELEITNAKRGPQSLPCFHLYFYQELKNATQGFRESNKIGEGGFGTVYKNKHSEMMCFTIWCKKSFSSPEMEITNAKRVGASVMVVILIILTCIFKRKFFFKTLAVFSHKRSSSAQNVKAFLMNYGALSPRRYKYSKIKKIT